MVVGGVLLVGGWLVVVGGGGVCVFVVWCCACKGCGGGWLFKGCACGEYTCMGEYDGTRGLLCWFVCFR